MPFFKNLDHEKNIYIWQEAGIGDQIIYARFFKNISSKQRTIYCNVNSKLSNLFKRSFPEITFVKKLDIKQTQYQIPMADLCRFYIKKTNDVVKNSFPFLRIDENKSQLV